MSPLTMLAAVFTPGTPKPTISMESIAVPIPSRNEVLLKGEVVDVGEDVSKEYYSDGSIWAVHGPNACGHCGQCRRGHDNRCVGNRLQFGLGRGGGYAEYIAVPASSLVKIPEGVPVEIAAVVTDAVLTPYHALKTLGNVRASDRVLVIGLGGLGLNGIQVAKSLGGFVVGADINTSKFDLAKQLGVDQCIDSTDQKAMDALGGFDVVVDFVGINATFQLGIKMLKSGGRHISVGLSGKEFSFNSKALLIQEGSFQVAYWGTSWELREVLDLVAAGKIKPQVEVKPLSEVIQCLEALREGKVLARQVVVP
ncbi:hypothetical protein BZG36_04833 [Bifiguratus adelaidae]|uniref:Enoyl reductase (ER) domain-containing protein n=1 Tax=Bifiguratus adelaidae TaxID=1938954 RepID=A0A261XUA8_9FUNG|nr:hypothetical protein BZG36_04833 [Bifiguratus adelaidae]